MDRDLMPCLWYASEALEAADHYVSLVPDSRIDRVTRGDDGAVIVVNLTVAGRPVMMLNGNPGAAFTDACSMVLSVATQDELDYVWDGLLAAGGSPKACGWLTDRYGVAWQIVPALLWKLIDPARGDASARVMQAVWQMVKIDIATLERAFEGGREQ